MICEECFTCSKNVLTNRVDSIKINDAENPSHREDPGRMPSTYDFKVPHVGMESNIEMEFNLPFNISAQLNQKEFLKTCPSLNLLNYTLIKQISSHWP